MAGTQGHTPGGLNHLLVIFWVAIVIFVGSTISACLVTCHRIDKLSERLPKDQNYPIAKEIPVRISESSKDSISADSANQILREIVRQQAETRTHNADLILDVRQEVNNNLDRISIWLTIWVAILGLLGVFIPLFMQFTVFKNEKSRIDETIAKADNKLIEIEQKADKDIKEAKQEVMAIASQEHVKEIQRLANALNLGIDFRLIKELDQKSDFDIHFFNASLENLKSLIDDLKSAYKDQFTNIKPKDEWLIIESFIFIWAITTRTFQHISTPPGEPFLIVENSIRKLLQDINDHTYSNAQSVFSRASEILNKLRALPSKE